MTLITPTQTRAPFAPTMTTSADAPTIGPTLTTARYYRNDEEQLARYQRMATLRQQQANDIDCYIIVARAKAQTCAEESEREKWLNQAHTLVWLKGHYMASAKHWINRADELTARMLGYYPHHRLNSPQLEQPDVLDPLHNL